VASPGGAIVPRPGCRVQFKVSTARPWYREIRKIDTDTIIEIAPVQLCIFERNATLGPVLRQVADLE